jgi:hypothetical protein
MLYGCIHEKPITVHLQQKDTVSEKLFSVAPNELNQLSDKG